MLFVASTAMAQTIVGSAHDFSGDTWNTTGEICIVCHTPHNALSGVQPLWNHDLSTATYTPYSSNTLTATDVAQPTAESKNCLACHDGTVALESFGGNGTGSGGGPLGAGNPNNVGTDLSDDHPVSFTYDLALANADGGLADPTTVNSGLGGTITEDMLFGGEMQCSSCHGVHNETGQANFLIMANTASALCLTCHTK
jgi:predicted CXXCH cytochrome family protein